MNGKSFRFFIYVVLAALVFPWAFFLHSLSSEEASSRSSIEKEKTEILKDIETLERRLEVTRGCLEQAKTDLELRQCREEEKVRQFYEVIDKLSEIGMSAEERRIKRLERR
jgi:hypothetical protein